MLVTLQLRQQPLHFFATLHQDTDAAQSSTFSEVIQACGFMRVIMEIRSSDIRMFPSWIMWILRMEHFPADSIGMQNRMPSFDSLGWMSVRVVIEPDISVRNSGCRISVILSLIANLFGNIFRGPIFAGC